MAETTLTSPLTLDPRQATKLKVRRFTANDAQGMVHVVIDYYDAGGNVIFTDDFDLSGAQVVTWIANQEATILNRYMAAKGLTGTTA